MLGLTAARERDPPDAPTPASRAIAGEGSRALTGFALDLADAARPRHRHAPRPDDVGAATSRVRHPDARRVHAELVDRKVIVDYRDPDVLRFGLSPLTTRFVDVYDALPSSANWRDAPRRPIS